jgi:hypothetical protein
MARRWVPEIDEPQVTAHIQSDALRLAQVGGVWQRRFCVREREPLNPNL